MAQYVGRSNMLAQGIADSREVRQQPYWAQLDVNGTADLRFFTAVPATAVAGNMQVAGQFPAPKQALIYGISAYLPPDTPLADAVEIMGNAAGTTGRVIVFRIADKEYLRVPIWLASQAGGLFTTGAPVAVSSVSNGWPSAANFYHIKPALLVPKQQNFEVLLINNSALTGAVFLTLLLHVTEERAVQ